MDGSSTPNDGRVGCLESVNIGTPRTITYRGQPVQTSIWKEPVEGPVPVRGVHVGGDIQADTSVHGGPDKAVYAYSVEDYAWWSEELGRPLGPGTFGENLTVSGLPVSQAVIGERWAVGTTLLAVAQPRLPCFKLATKMGDPHFLKRFLRALRLGAYLRIVEEGVLQAGDRVEVVERPDHGVTVETMGRTQLGDRESLARLLDAPQIPDAWRSWAEHVLEAEAGRR